MFFKTFFYNDKQIFFLFDTTNNTITCHFISGNNGEVGLPIKNEFTAKELLDYIKSDNMLAEVEGKNTFIKKIIHNFHSFENNLFFYVPIKSKSSPIFQYTDLVSYQHLIIY